MKNGLYEQADGSVTHFISDEPRAYVKAENVRAYCEAVGLSTSSIIPHAA